MYLMLLYLALPEYRRGDDSSYYLLSIHNVAALNNYYRNAKERLRLIAFNDAAPPLLLLAGKRCVFTGAITGAVLGAVSTVPCPVTGSISRTAAGASAITAVSRPAAVPRTIAGTVSGTVPAAETTVSGTAVP